ncbi:response regulator transcription factor [Kitasatospora cineracea]|nr:response regulator transcription factor [Kitasatospora cineracea]
MNGLTDRLWRPLRGLVGVSSPTERGWRGQPLGRRYFASLLDFPLPLPALQAAAAGPRPPQAEDQQAQPITRVAIVSVFLIRAGLTALMHAMQSGLHVMVDVDDPAELPDPSQYELLILDLDRLDHPLDVIEQLAPQVKILALSISLEPADAANALRAGALGYMTKADRPEEFVSAIEAVRSGQLVTSRTLLHSTR